ncbi:hypothetical protein BIW11_06048 [Tropilaelaps mercedesae]|uniref:Uncharacterized protein n=1 Tax=Tropilaelaps mercedesae TaxID=418985 RepID=A0A1V9XZT3_9ACAR|nr:hypothetical protein BIW11_06048 [Tropilaelaps mercedesae]
MFFCLQLFSNGTLHYTLTYDTFASSPATSNRNFKSSGHFGFADLKGKVDSLLHQLSLALLRPRLSFPWHPKPYDRFCYKSVRSTGKLTTGSALAAFNEAMFTKLFVLLALVACAFGGVLKDVTGGTFDLTTGQYSSAITGRVYNSAPVVAAAPVALSAYIAPYAVPYAVPYAAYSYGYTHGGFYH